MPPPPTAEKSSAASTARTLPPEQPPTPATPAATATATPPEPEVAATESGAAAAGVPASTSSFLEHVSLCLPKLESNAIFFAYTQLLSCEFAHVVYLGVCARVAEGWCPVCAQGD